MGRIIAIGDVHGCYEALDAVLCAVAPRPDDTIITLGDYVNRGPDSRGVLELLIDLSARCRLVPLLGNHDEVFLAVIEGRIGTGHLLAMNGRATIESYGGSLNRVPAAHSDFLRGCRDWSETERHLFTHAAYIETLPMDRQPADALRWQSLREDVPGPHASGKTAIVGHTSQKDGAVLDLGHIICIDTACVKGGWLTALDVEAGRLWQADRRGKLRRGTGAIP